MQAKLLRVLESGEVIRLGANATKKVDVRFVSATNQDMQKAIAEGTFREDLFFRIGGAHVHLPPLRERREDIPRIVRHAIAKSASEMGREPPEITDAAMLRLTGAHWPGNVRQLLNVVQNMVVLSGGATLDVQHVPEGVVASGNDDDGGAGGTGSLAGASLEQLEKRAIRETLRLTGGNREQTAKLLGIGERTLYRKLKDYGLR